MPSAPRTFNTVAFAARQTQVAAPAAVEPGSALEQQLWLQLTAGKRDAGRSVYVDGVPIDYCKDDSKSAQVSAAQVLLYYDRKFGSIAPRHRTKPLNRELLAAHVESVKSKLRKEGISLNDREILGGLIALDQHRERKFAETLSELPQASEVAYVRHLIDIHSSPAASEIDGLISALGSIGREFHYVSKINDRRNGVDAEVIARALASGELPITRTSNTSWSTVVGIVTEGTERYVLVHEPRQVSPELPDTAFGSRESNQLIRGMRFYPWRELQTNPTIFISPPAFDAKVFASFVSMNTPFTKSKQ